MTIDVQWEFHHLNDPDDIINSRVYSEGVGPGTLVGGDDALRDGSDSTYLEAVGLDTGLQVCTARMRPLSPVPSTPVVSVSQWARYYGGHNPALTFPTDHITMWADGIDDQYPWIDIYPGLDHLGESETIRREGSVWPRILGKYVQPGWEDRFWTLNASERYTYRLYGLTLTTHHEGTPDYPLRQVQRDDHLAAGSPRATAATSRQGSIRQRGYE